MNSNLAFVFPGQGSQKIGMLADLAAAHPLVEETFKEASDVLGYDAWKLIQEGEQEDINLTERTQPLLLTSSVAIWRLWQQQGGPQPAAMAGHSLGEWSALVCAGVVSFADAVEIVRARGAFMQQAVPVGVGAMAAIMGIEDQIVIDACAEAAQGQIAAAVNFNAPGQVVIAGDAAAVGRAVDICKKAGAKRAVELPV
ncbi:MAG: ACP S-malonyltransferase, partial [Porticoccaceae bacterium]